MNASYAGFTADAEERLRANDVLFSERDDLNELLRRLNLRELPEL